MKFCWTFNSIPELGFVADKQRRELLRSTLPRGIAIKLWTHSIFVGILVGGFTSIFLAMDLWPTALWIVVVGVLTTAIWFQLQMIRVRVQIRLILLDQFQDDIVPVCLECGYNLVGSKSIKCPECGASTFVPKKETKGL